MFEYLMGNAWKRQRCLIFNFFFFIYAKLSFLDAALFQYLSPETEQKRKCMSIGMYVITKN